MLLSLRVRNLAVIEAADLDFQTGLHVVSGETGAGKSVLLRALRLGLGQRGSRSWVRTGALCAEIGLRVELDGQTRYVERRLNAGGGGQARLDGAPISVAQLRELGERIGRICGQHDASALLEPDRHRVLIDRFGAVDTGDMVQAWSVWCAARDAARSLRDSADTAVEQAEFLRYQVDELASFGPVHGELERLEGEQRRLRHAAQLRQNIAAVEYELASSDGAVAQRLVIAERLLRDLATIDSAHAQQAEALAELRYTVEGLVDDVRGYGGTSDDPYRLEEIGDRLSEIHRLCRKHRCTADALPDVLERLENKLETLENLTSRLAEAEKRAAAARAAAESLAATLSSARKRASAALDGEVTGCLRSLAMPNAVFRTRVEPGELGPHGSDQVVFLLSANLGEIEQPLHKVASGGELSRVLLSVEVAMSARGRGSSCLIFDEVDSGMGGQTADAVGRRLTELSRQGQVLCISHLPQIARLADHHYAVRKTESDGRTTSAVALLDESERTSELARMLGGAFASEWMAQVA